MQVRRDNNHDIEVTVTLSEDHSNFDRNNWYVQTLPTAGVGPKVAVVTRNLRKLEETQKFILDGVNITDDLTISITQKVDGIEVQELPEENWDDDKQDQWTQTEN